MSSARQEKAYAFSKQDALQYLPVAVFLVINGKLFGLASTGIIVPYLHPSGGPYSVVQGAYDALEYSIAKAVFPVLVLGVIYLTGVLVGKVFCGWACPLGMVQDFMAYLPFKKTPPSPSMHAGIKDLKYAVAGLSLLVAILVGFRRSTVPNSMPAGVFSDVPFAVGSPASTLFAYLPWLAIWHADVMANSGFVVSFKFVLLFFFLAPALVVPRYFCRYWCPLGTILDPIAKYKALRIARNTKAPKEEQNKVLAEVCPMGVQIESNSSEFIDHVGCVHCGKCVTAEPKHFSQEFKPL